MASELVSQLSELFEKVGPAHHQAFIETDGSDPDWALWYAEFLIGDLQALLGPKVTKTKVVRCLVAADAEHAALGGETPWPLYYARHFAERLAPATAATDKLSLYYFPSCPFCRRVLNALGQLSVAVDLRDITAVPEHRQDLIDARGRATVPVLRIDCADGDSRWMPESADIIDYLQDTYG